MEGLTLSSSNSISYGIFDRDVNFERYTVYTKKPYYRQNEYWFFRCSVA